MIENDGVRGTPIVRKLGEQHLDSADIVIIGNGIAGLSAALEARQHDPEARIVMLTEQNFPTINTPALKQFAIGKLEREQLLANSAGTERAQRIHVVNERVEEINAQGKFVSFTGGRGFGYGSLLIATGCSPTGLSAEIPGQNFDGVMTLHCLQDYLDLRRRIPKVSEAVVVGSGAHAIETVMNLVYWGIRVHWLIRGATCLSNMLDQPASDMVMKRVQKAGVKVYTQTQVMGVVGRVGAVMSVVTNHQQMIPCQLVLTCTGTTPVTTLAEHCNIPLKHKRGIWVDDQLRTSVPDIYAAGDVAALKNPQTGIYETRAQWYAAGMQGRIAAAVMTGHADSIKESFGVPWHATNVGGLSMLMVGSPLSSSEDVVTLTDSNKTSYRRISIIDDRLIGYLSLGTSQVDSLAIKRIVDEGIPIRDVKKALLSGKLDIRAFILQQHSSAAQQVVTGNLGSSNAPNAITSGSRQSQARPQPFTSGNLAAYSRTRTGLPASALAGNNIRGIPQTDPLATIPKATRVYPQALPPIAEEEMSSFTGTLPAFLREGRWSSPAEVSPDVSSPHSTTGSHWSYSDDQVIRTGHEENEILADNLKESVALPRGCPPKQNTNPRGLWSYATKREEVKVYDV